MTIGRRFGFISEGRGSKLPLITTDENPLLEFGYRTKRGEKKTRREKLTDFVDVKGWKAKGNKLGNYLRISSFQLIANDSNLKPADIMDGKTADELTLFT